MFFFTIVLLNIIDIEKYNFKSDMNSNRICLNCGSSDLVSDRSLGGKIVCFKCGSSSFKTKSISPLKNTKIIYLILGFIVLLIIIFL